MCARVHAHLGSFAHGELLSPRSQRAKREGAVSSRNQLVDTMTAVSAEAVEGRDAPTALLDQPGPTPERSRGAHGDAFVSSQRAASKLF